MYIILTPPSPSPLHLFPWSPQSHSRTQHFSYNYYWLEHTHAHPHTHTQPTGSWNVTYLYKYLELDNILDGKNWLFLSQKPLLLVFHHWRVGPCEISPMALRGSLGSLSRSCLGMLIRFHECNIYKMLYSGRIHGLWFLRSFFSSFFAVCFTSNFILLMTYILRK